MRSKSYEPKKLQEATTRLEERQERLEETTKPTQKTKKRGLLARLFGWMG